MNEESRNAMTKSPGPPSDSAEPLTQLMKDLTYFGIFWAVGTRILCANQRPER